MKKTLIVLAMLITTLIFCTSCRGNNDFYNTNKEIIQMKSYSTDAYITIYGNKGISNYKVKHFYKAPDKVRIETIEPEFLKGKVLVYSNNKWKIYHPLINQSFETSELKEPEKIIYLGMLQKSILSGENAKYSYVKKDGAEFIEIKAEIPEGNAYRKYLAVLLSKGNFIPQVLEIYDSNNQLAVRVKYIDFKYNVEIPDNQFIL